MNQDDLERCAADPDRIMEFVASAELPVTSIKIQPFLGADVSWEQAAAGYEILVYSRIAGTHYADRLILLALTDILARERPWYRMPDGATYTSACAKFLEEFVLPSEREFIDLHLCTTYWALRHAFAFTYLAKGVLSHSELEELVAASAKRVPGSGQGVGEYVALLAAMKVSGFPAHAFIEAIVEQRHYSLLEAVEVVRRCLEAAEISSEQLIGIAKNTFPSFLGITGIEAFSYLRRRFEMPVFEYDVALSFAGEDRSTAEAIAAKLRATGYRVFYDAYERADLWGKDLYSHLAEIYSKRSRYCLIMISAGYARKQWTNHERKAAQARAFRDNIEYILPLRLDDTEIPGIPETVGYIDLRTTSIDEVVELLKGKLAISAR